MLKQNYEVLYVDKFNSAQEAAATRASLCKTFGLKPHQWDRMSSGDPVVIKKGVAYDEAERYLKAIAQAGGTAWVQELDADGNHIERRTMKRRQLFDRRAVYRASSIQPDRRQSRGRRSTDKVLIH
ncbi:hypothetical protein NBRC116494_26490 [Aurantivibrio plasticivorans]